MIHTGVTFLDYWTISHLAFWIVVGSTLAASSRASSWSGYIRVCLGCLVFAVIWELFERYAEVAWPSIWQSPESAVNIVSDICTVIAGTALSWFGFLHWRPK